MNAEPAGSGSAAPGEAPASDGDELDDMLKGAFDDKPAESAAPPADSAGPTGKVEDEPKEEPAPADSAEQAPKQVTAKHMVAHRTVTPSTRAKPVRAVARKN